MSLWYHHFEIIQLLCWRLPVPMSHDCLLTGFILIWLCPRLFHPNGFSTMPQDFKQLEDFAAFSEVEQEALSLPPLPPSREAAKAGERAKTTWLLLDVHFPGEIVIMWWWHILNPDYDYQTYQVVRFCFWTLPFPGTSLVHWPLFPFRFGPPFRASSMNVCM